MRLTLLFTINILSYKGLHNCVKEVKNLEQLKERERQKCVRRNDGIFSCFVAEGNLAEVTLVRVPQRHVVMTFWFYGAVVLGYVREKCLFYVILRGSISGTLGSLGFLS